MSMGLGYKGKLIHDEKSESNEKCQMEKVTKRVLLKIIPADEISNRY